MLKQCTKCKKELPATKEYFYAHKQHSSGLHSWCKQCHNEINKQWQKDNREKCKKRQRRYQKTIKGYLVRVWNSMNTRCYNPKHKQHYRYGGRGIQNKFKNPSEFRDYVINELEYDSYEKIKGLQIDRINNNRHYEPGNIRFVTPKVNCRNRG